MGASARQQASRRGRRSSRPMSERTALPAVSAKELELSPGWRAALDDYDRELTRRGAPPPPGAPTPRDLLELGAWATERRREPGELAYRDLRAYAAALSERRLARAERWRESSPRCAGFTRTWSPRGAATPEPRRPAAERRSGRLALPRVLARDEVGALLDRIPARTPLEVRDRALFELAYSCGLRADEIVSLDLGDVDFESETRARHRQGRQDAPGADRRAGPARAAPLPGDRATGARPAGGGDGAVRVAAADGGSRLRRAPPARALGSRGGGRRAASPRTRCATRSRPICSRAAPTCARSRSCWDTRACRPPRSTRGWSRRGCASSTQSLTRGHKRAWVAFQPANSIRVRVWRRTSRPSSFGSSGVATRRTATRRPASDSSSPTRRWSSSSPAGWPPGCPAMSRSPT